jgi:hypothetical protein
MVARALFLMLWGFIPVGCMRGPTDELCNGNEELRLATLSLSESGSLGERVLFENGTWNLFLNGRCELWTRAGNFSEVRMRTISMEEARELERKVGVPDWSRLYSRSSEYCNPGTDSPRFEFFFRGNVLAFGCLGLAPTIEYAEWESVLQRHAAAIGELHPLGEPVRGAVRFLLDGPNLPDVNIAPQLLRNAEPWPLGDPLDVVVEDRRPSLIAPTVRVVTGDDADVLREYRTRYVSGEIGAHPLAGVPFIEKDGTAYFLYLRDSYPFEDKDGRVSLPGKGFSPDAAADDNFF